MRMYEFNFIKLLFKRKWQILIVNFMHKVSKFQIVNVINGFIRGTQIE